jgi:DNA-binding NtrC family response regulator
MSESTADHVAPIRLLVLDDLPHIGDMLRRDPRFQVESIDDPARLMTMIDQGRLTCDVCVFDIDLKAELTGFHVLSHLRRFNPSIPVIMLSAFTEGDYVRKSWHMGATDYLTKPILPRKLVKVILDLHASAFRPNSSELVGTSAVMVELRRKISQFATQPHPVLIRGETGTGKELVARSLHQLSDRREAPLVAINCGALAAELVDSELFGHVRGAFTGALTDRPGLLAEAHHGTLLLDEIGDMPLPLQAKLLRALQEREVRAVGTNTVRAVDLRVIAATHVDLQEAIDRGHFRLDLYFRLNVLSLTVPPLRDRMEDVPMLAELFLRKHAKSGRPLQLHPATLDRMMSSRWPGNVRQLESAIQRATALCTGELILPEHLPDDIENMQEAWKKVEADTRPEEPDGEIEVLRDARRRMIDAFMVQYLRRVMSHAGGVVAEAARIAGLDRANFRRLLRAHRIDPQDFRGGNSPAGNGPAGSGPAGQRSGPHATVPDPDEALDGGAGPDQALDGGADPDPDSDSVE